MRRARTRYGSIRPSLLGIVALCASCLIWVAATQAGSTRSTGSAWTAGEGSDIYLINANGTQRRQLTETRADAFYQFPEWSRRTGKIAFSGSSCDDCAATLFVADPMHGDINRLVVGVGSAERPSWAPNGTRFVFVGGSSQQIFTIKIDGSGTRQLTAEPASHDQAVWSPDGQQIAYTRQQLNGKWDIYLMNANGSSKRPLTRTGTSEEDPAWAPDGRRLAFTRQVGGRWGIYVIDLRNGRERRVTGAALTSENPSWSPDGRRLAFTRVTRTRLSVYVMALEGLKTRRLVTGIARSFDPSWSPDGTKIAFTGQT